MEKIEKVLRDFTRKIPSVKNLSYWERLQELRMNSENRRLERYKIIYVWKILENIVPNPGVMITNENWNDDNFLRGRLCSIPKWKSKEKLDSFQVMGPRIFNTLPKVIRNMTKCGIEEFKSVLDMFLT